MNLKSISSRQNSLIYSLTVIFVVADLYALFEVIFSGVPHQFFTLVSKNFTQFDFQFILDTFVSRPIRLNLLLFTTLAGGVISILTPFLFWKKTRSWLWLESRIICLGVFLLLGFSTAIYLAHIYATGNFKIKVFSLISVGFFYLVWLGNLYLIFHFTHFRFLDYRIILFSSLGIFRSLIFLRSFIFSNYSFTPSLIVMFLILCLISQLVALGVGVFFSWLAENWRFGIRLGKALAMVVLGLSLWNLSLPPRQWLKIYFQRLSLSSLFPSAGKSEEIFRGQLKQPAPNVILIVLDTVRADHLSLYGYPRKTTPFLEWLGRRSVVFERAYSASPWTVPSHASIFSGLLPSEHFCNYENLRLYSGVKTLAEKLREQGYITMGYSNNPGVNRSVGLAQGFDRFVEGGTVYTFKYSGSIIHWLSVVLLRPELMIDSGARLTNLTLTKWFWRLSQQKRPFFLFVNYMEAHLPYPNNLEAFKFFPEPKKAKKLYSNFQLEWYRLNCQAEIDARTKEIAINRYDGAIYYLDLMLSRLWEKLQKFHLLDNSIIIITSDHGEMLGEHKFWGHTYFLWEPLLRVPLIIYYPKLLFPTRIKTPISLVELAFIIQNLALGKIPYQLSHPRSRPILAEVFYPHLVIDLLKDFCSSTQLKQFQRRKKALIDWPYKLIWDSQGDDLLFNLESDPEEKNNLMHKEITTYVELNSLINLYRAKARGKKREFTSFAPPTKNVLQALGYVR